MTTEGNGNQAGLAYVRTREGREIPRGASQVGVFDMVPPLGYREYWYPGIHDQLVGRKPITLKMLGEDLVFFRDTKGEVAALTDYCPHRGARLSGGTRRTPGGGPMPGKLNDEFKGFITCPYHGYTYDGDGVCVAALTDGPSSGLVGKLRARKYPTRTFRGVVWVWMGQTEPAPLEEDLPHIDDPDVIFKAYVRNWDLNWSLTIENSQDSHEGKIHRGSRRRIWNLALFRQSGSFWGGSRITQEADSWFNIAGTLNPRPRQGFYPGLNSKWPKHVWWRVKGMFGGGLPAMGATSPVQFDPDRKGGVYRLPAMASPGNPTAVCHMRFAVPITEDTCRTWTFTLSRKSIKKGWLAQLWWTIHYHIWYTYIFMQGTNENEDLPVQSVGCLDPDMPQKLGASDASTIYWRRRLPLRSRDYQRLWSTEDVEATAESVEQTEDKEIAEEPLPLSAPSAG